ncbi:MAG TPA: ATPase, T2SS/T4P/T4SS family, partial [Gemmatimonadales bacterium]|nr:ATPase, T2SS/T4P/T4SS family [Gemmatimonadales bacterium]
MAQLDRFIQAIQQHKAQGLVLAPGKQASLLFDGAPRPITRDALSGAQIVPLVREIAPLAEHERLEGLLPVTFLYDSPSGPVSVEFIPEADGPRVLIRAAATAEATPPAAAAPPAAARPSLASASPGPARAMMDQLLRLTVDSGASDLHLRSGEQPILRRDGELVRQEGQALDVELLDQMLVSVMPTRDQSTYRETGDVDWAYDVPGLARFRANAAQERRGPMGVFRVISSKILSAEELGLSAEVQKLCMLNRGLVLVTGPTGSGKSTTLAAMV